MTRRLPPRAVAALVLTLSLWGSAFPGIRRALESYSPGALAFFRFSVASIVLGVVLGIRGLPRPRREDALRLAVAGAVGIAGYTLSLNVGQRTVTAGAASLVVNTAPIWTALFSIAFLGERFGPLRWIGMAIGFLGASIVSLRGGGPSWATGSLFVFVAALCHSVYIILQKPLAERYGALAATGYAIWIGTLCLVPFAPAALSGIARAPLGATATVLYLGAGPAAVAYLSWSYVLTFLPASRVVSFLYFVPLVAFVLAWLWLGERPTWTTLAGAALILGGVSLVQRGASRSARPGAPWTETEPAA